MKKCRKCGKTEKDGIKFYTRKNKYGKPYQRLDCSKCYNTANTARKREKRLLRERRRYSKNESMFTTTRQRAVNPWKCLGLDVLTSAVMAHKEGEEMHGFWYSNRFETLCDLADQLPEFIRRGLGVEEAPIPQENP